MSFIKIDWTGLGKFLLQRLTERSTWLGVIGAFSAAGYALTPELREQFAAAGTAIASILMVFTRDKPVIVVHAPAEAPK